MSRDQRPTSDSPGLLRAVPALALVAVIVVTASSEWQLARTVLDLPPAVAWAVPVAIDSYVVAALRTGRDIVPALGVMAGALGASTWAHLAAVGLPAGERLPVHVTAPAAAVIMAVLVVVAWRVHVLIEHLGRRPSDAARATTVAAVAVSGSSAPEPVRSVPVAPASLSATAARPEASRAVEVVAAQESTRSDDDILAEVSGTAPSIRSLMRTYAIGQARATRIHRQITTTTKAEHAKKSHGQSSEGANREEGKEHETSNQQKADYESARSDDHETHPCITDRVGGLSAAERAPAEGDGALFGMRRAAEGG